VIVDLVSQATFDGVNQDTLNSIENAIGSRFDDQLWGDDGANRLQGGAGADSLMGYGGADTLFGDAGDDRLIGGLGDDRMDGGAGFDVAIFQGSRASYTLTRNSDGSTTVAGGDGIDIVIGVEQLRFDGEQVTLVQAPAAGGMNPLPLTDGLLDLVCTDGPWVL
jgi:serralysin